MRSLVWIPSELGSCRFRHPHACTWKCTQEALPACGCTPADKPLCPRTQVDAARMAAAQAHLQQRAALEESALPIMLDTMVCVVPLFSQ